MRMLFPYSPITVRQPLWSLRGRTTRPRPLIPVLLIGPKGSVLRDCLLDTGSDDTVFRDQDVANLGLDLTNAPTNTAAGVGKVAVSLRYAEVSLRIARSGEQREWTARVGFTAAPLHQPLLGFPGFLEYFTATFHGDREEVELTVNSLYAGT
jgi:predicted aspartyl protease